ncbi:MAG: Arc family DNA-binding protein [Verrucomicrobia bacterium]|nr:Arc family DNA-binding protein [Verrucomicrobiota bacterium]
MAERKSFLLRIDAKLWQELEQWAQEDLRSVNGQIEFLLREAMVRRKRKRAEKSSGDQQKVINKEQ